MADTDLEELFERYSGGQEYGMNTPLDSQWAKHSFLATGNSIGADTGIREHELWSSSADRKYTDTQMGGSIGVGARPQFTRYSDPRALGVLKGRRMNSVHEHTGNNGLGRLYSEKYEDTAEVIFMRFGVPQFNSLSSFFAEFSDTEITRLAVSGRTSSKLYTLGKAVGTLTVIIAAPLLSLSVFALKAIATWFTYRKSTRFYTIKPTMAVYWSTVNTLVNTLSVNRGLVSRANLTSSRGPNRTDDSSKITAGVMEEYMPNLISASGFVDVGAIANRAQRRSNNLNGHIAGEPIGDEGMTMGDLDKDSVDTYDQTISFQDMLGNFAKVDGWYSNTDDSPNGYKTQFKPKEVHANSWTKEKNQAGYEGKAGLLMKLKDSLRAEFQQGSQWAIFRVDQITSSSESFSNSVKTNEIADKFNAQTSTVRDLKFNIAGGNISDGAVGSALEGIAGGLKDLFTGLASGISFNFTEAAFAMLSGVTMEMPKYWDSANAELSNADYTMTLISPYNNAWSHMQNIYIPLCMLLAGALPLKSGAQSHVSPLLCSVYNKGKTQKLLGMISSISIERGVTNMPFDIAGHALSMNVSFSITDLAPCMSVPVSAGTLMNGLTGDQIDEDSAIFDFLATLAAMTVAEQGDGLPAAKVRILRGLNALDKFTSPSAWALTGYEALLSNPITAIPTRIGTAIAKSNALITDDNRQDIISYRQ